MKLGKEIDEMLSDFCEAHYGCPRINVIRAAVADFIASERQKNRGIRDRMDAERAKRISSRAPRLVISR